MESVKGETVNKTFKGFSELKMKYIEVGFFLILGVNTSCLLM